MNAVLFTALFCECAEGPSSNGANGGGNRCIICGAEKAVWWHAQGSVTFGVAHTPIPTSLAGPDLGLDGLDCSLSLIFEQTKTKCAAEIGLPKAKEIMGARALESLPTAFFDWFVAGAKFCMHAEVEAQKSAMAYKHHQEAKTKGAEINADTINKALGGEFMSKVFLFGLVPRQVGDLSRLLAFQPQYKARQMPPYRIITYVNNMRRRPEDEALLRARPDVAQGELVRVTDQFCFCSLRLRGSCRGITSCAGLEIVDPRQL